MSARNSTRKHSRNIFHKFKVSKSVRLGVLIAFVGILMLFSETGQQAVYSQITPNAPDIPNLEENVPVLADNLYTTPTGSLVTTIAPGTVDGFSGYAYYDMDGYRLIFVDPIQGIYYGLPLPSIGTVYQSTLIPYDMDQDTNTEFLIGHYNGTNWIVLEVDFNDLTVTQYVMSVSKIDEIIVGNYNGDAWPDFAVLDKLSDRIEFYDPDTSAQLGIFNKGVNIDYVDVGKLAYLIQDSLVVVMNDTVSVVRSDGVELYWTQLPYKISGVGVFNYSLTNYDDFAIVMDAGPIAAFHGNNLTNIWSRGLSPYSSQPFYIKSGNFTGDSIEDLVVISREHDVAWFVDGASGVNYGANSDQLSGDYHFDVGQIDSDDLDDVALRNWFGQPTFIHGDGLGLGFTEREAQGTENVYLYDINSDGRQDIIAVARYEVYTVISDTNIPAVTPQPITPLHPTALDDYFIMEYGIFEESSMEEARIYVRRAGTTEYTIQVDMQPNAAGVKYFGFVMGVEPGHYEYYVHFVDSYRNEAFNGTPASPNAFEVIGNTAWDYEKPDVTLGASIHVFDRGNNSAGDIVLYTAGVNDTGQYAKVDKYALTGEILDSVNVSISAGKVWDYGIYTAMVDGDNVSDLILILSNTTATYSYVYHGVNMSLWYYSTQGIIDDLSMIAITDDDSDGYEELHILDNTKYELFRMDQDGTWSNKQFASLRPIDTAMIAPSSGDGDWQILTVTNRTRVDFYDAANLTAVRTSFLYFKPSFTKIDAPIAFAFNNASLTTQQFGLHYTIWNATGPVSRLYFFDVFTPNLNFTSIDYKDLHVRNVIVHDADADGTDELFVVDYDGQLSLIDISRPLNINWTLPVGTAILTGHVVTDFDGNGFDDLVLFTHQDQKLRAIDIRGFISREIHLGEIVLNPIAVGNADPGLGDDIAAYPIIKDWTTFKVGVYRDLDWFYRFNITTSLQSTIVQQGNPIVANVTVENIFGESLHDATVTMTMSYWMGGELTHRTSSLLYSFVDAQYVFDETSSLPMGVVNLTLDVIHDDYHSIFDYDVGQVTVESFLVVAVHQNPSVIQGQTYQVGVVVTDVLGLIVPDATVEVTIDGTLYFALYAPTSQSYSITIPGVTWTPNEYTTNVTATYLYSPTPTTILDNFTVLANSLIISNNIPTQIDQGQPFQGWLNITDPYTNPIANAIVVIESGDWRFTLTEMDSGKYYLDELADLPIANYTFSIRVIGDYVSGEAFGNFSIAITGDLMPSVVYSPQVDAGTNFTVSIFIYDAYGSTPSGSTAIVEFLGTNYTAIHVGGPEYSVELNASTMIGLNQFIVYLNSTYGNDWVTTFDFYVHSEPTISLGSDLGWTLVQGTTTTLRVDVSDWSGASIPGATVTLLSPISIGFVDHFNGTYTVDLSTAGYGPGNYSVLISVFHEFLAANQTSHQLYIQGLVDVSVEVPTTVLSLQSTTFNFTVTDQYGNPLSNFDYDITFTIDSISSTSTSHEFSWTTTPITYPGKNWLNITISGTNLFTSTHNFSIDVRGVMQISISTPTVNQIVNQADDVNYTILLTDTAGVPIIDAYVFMQIAGSSNELFHIGSGYYSANISTVGLPLGSYNTTITLEQAFMDTTILWRVILLKGTAVVSLVTTPTNPEDHQNLSFNLTLTDQFGNPINSANYSLSFDGQSTSGTTSSYKFSWTITPNTPPGMYQLNVSLDSGYLIAANYTFDITLKGTISESILLPVMNAIHTQGSDVNFTVHIQDLILLNITGAQVSVSVHGGSYILSMTTDGIYTTEVSTIGFPLGSYNATITISHPYMGSETTFVIFILTGDAVISLDSSPTTIYNHLGATFNFTILDSYGNPINIYNYSLTFSSSFTTSGQGSSYILVWGLTPDVVPGSHWLNITLNSTYLNPVSYNYSIPVFGTPTITLETPADYSTHTQGQDINFTIILEDLIGTEIDSAQVRVLIAGSTYTLTQIGDGVYSRNISTVGLRLDQYPVNITVLHGYLDTGYESLVVVIRGTPTLTVTMNPSPVSNKENVTFDMTLTDLYGNPINAFNYSLQIESYSKSVLSNWYQFSWEIEPNWIPGNYYLIIDVNSTYAFTTQYNVTVPVQGVSSANLLDPLAGSAYSQGDFINFTVHVTDELFNNITGADVTVVLYGSSFTLNMTTDGIYTGNVSTVGLPLGSYVAAISVSQAFLDTQQLTVELSLQGEAVITYSLDSTMILNHQSSTFTFFIRDQYGNPLKPFNYSVSLSSSFTKTATSSVYSFDWTLNPTLLPGQYYLNISVESKYILQSNFSWSVDVFGIQSATFQSPITDQIVNQGNLLTLSIHLQDLNLNDINQASVVVTIGSSSYTLIEVEAGIYNRTITTTHLSVGEYIARVTIQHNYLQTADLNRNFSLVGRGKLSLDYIQPVLVGENSTFSIGIFDTFTHSVNGYNWVIKFQGNSYSGSTPIDSNEFNLTMLITGPPGTYQFIVNITNPFLTFSNFSSLVIIKSNALATISNPISTVEFLQGVDEIPFTITVTDSLGNLIEDANVRVQIATSVIELDSYDNGTYYSLVSTIGWRYNDYPYFVYVSHTYMDLLVLNGTVTVIADPEITVHTSSTEAIQFTNFTIDVEVKDRYGNPITGLNVEVDFAQQPQRASEIEDGLYRVEFENFYAPHKTYQISVSVNGSMCRTESYDEMSIKVVVQEPDLDSLWTQSPDVWLMAIGVTLLISLIGMGLYFRVASSISNEARTVEEAEKGTRRLDFTYGIVLTLAMIIFGHSIISGNEGNYALALVECILMIGFSVLLYGLWLYRDSYSAIMYTRTLDRRRVVAGIWHLALVPVMLFQILQYGNYIEQFQALIIEENVFTIMGTELPMILLTIFGTYLSSIVVVVFNHYRETSKGLQRIAHMEFTGTPESIVNEERTILVERTSSSIRTKFLMFLLLVGVTTVTSLNFVRSTNLAFLILLPVVFLVIIPFVSSKIIKAASGRKIRRKKEVTYTP